MGAVGDRGVAIGTEPDRVARDRGVGGAEGVVAGDDRDAAERVARDHVGVDRSADGGTPDLRPRVPFVGNRRVAGEVGADVVAPDRQARRALGAGLGDVHFDPLALVAGDQVAVAAAFPAGGEAFGAADGQVVAIRFDRVEGEVDAVGFVRDRGAAFAVCADPAAPDRVFGSVADPGQRPDLDSVLGVAGRGALRDRAASALKRDPVAAVPLVFGPAGVHPGNHVFDRRFVPIDGYPVAGEAVDGDVVDRAALGAQVEQQAGARGPAGHLVAVDLDPHDFFAQTLAAVDLDRIGEFRQQRERFDRRHRAAEFELDQVADRSVFAAGAVACLGVFDRGVQVCSPDRLAQRAVPVGDAFVAGVVDDHGRRAGGRGEGEAEGGCQEGSLEGASEPHGGTQSTG